MKRLLLTLSVVAALSGCKTTGDAYRASASLTYPAEPSYADVLLSLNSPIILDSYKCYASNMDISDNISPKGEQGYYCYKVIGQSGTMVFDGKQFIGLEKFNEVMRKHDDVYKFTSPVHNRVANTSVFKLKSSTDLTKAENQQAQVISGCYKKTNYQNDVLAKDISNKKTPWKAKLVNIDKSSVGVTAYLLPVSFNSKYHDKFEFRADILLKEKSGLANYNIGDVIEFEGDLVLITKGTILNDYACTASFKNGRFL